MGREDEGQKEGTRGSSSEGRTHGSGGDAKGIIVVGNARHTRLVVCS